MKRVPSSSQGQDDADTEFGLLLENTLHAVGPRWPDAHKRGGAHAGHQA